MLLAVLALDSALDHCVVGEVLIRHCDGVQRRADAEEVDDVVEEDPTSKY